MIVLFYGYDHTLTVINTQLNVLKTLNGNSAFMINDKCPAVDIRPCCHKYVCSPNLGYFLTFYCLPLTKQRVNSQLPDGGIVFLIGEINLFSCVTPITVYFHYCYIIFRRQGWSYGPHTVHRQVGLHHVQQHKQTEARRHTLICSVRSESLLVISH